MLVNLLPNENGVLVALPTSVHDRLRPSLKRVRLEAGITLYDIRSTSDHTWFITSGIVSLFAAARSGAVIEIATIGREGVAGLSVITKINGIKLWVRVQISGEALQIDARTLQNIIRRESAFHILFFKYMHTLSGQIAVTGACNRFHKAEQRLARWLLTARACVSGWRRARLLKRHWRIWRKSLRRREFIFTVSGSNAADWNANSNLRTMWPCWGKSMKSKPASKAGKLNLS